MSNGRERSQTALLHEKFYLASMYHTLRNHGHEKNTLGRLNFFKAVVINKHNTKAQSVSVDTREEVLYL
jgi:hypothetical protein